MAQRRASQVELCFDSMTDLITNLAGGLVVIVLLLFGITQETKKVDVPAEFASTKNKSAGGGKSLRPLELQAVSLRSEIARIENEMKILEDQKLPQLERDVADLLKRAKRK